MNKAHAKRISKLLSLALRHQPSALGITLDPQGWTSVTDLLLALSSHAEPIERADLEQVVRESEKQRFAFSENGTNIRANQGHSVAVNLGLTPSAPPSILLHGTSAQFLDSIREHGLLRGKRTHVHLSADEPTALQVARRHPAPSMILTVRAGKMHDLGHAFVRSENGVWLTEHVPPEHLELPPSTG